MLNRLKEFRKSQGLTQAELSEALGLAKAYIGQVECGSKEISDRTIRDICRIYNVNEEWLRTGDGAMYVPMTRNQHIADFLNQVMEDEPDSVRKRWIEVLSSTDVEFWEMLDRLAQEYVNKKEG